MNMAMWTVLGIAIGAGMSSATGHSAWGAAGAAVGLAIGSLFGKKANIKRKS